MILSEISGAVVCIVPFGDGVLAIGDLLRKLRQGQQEVSQEQVAEAGKFDFRWGVPASPGYYHHWSYFMDLTDREDSLFFVLRTGKTFRIPKAAFGSVAEAERFFAFARERWQRALLSQQYAAPTAEGVWPPPPRVER